MFYQVSTGAIYDSLTRAHVMSKPSRTQCVRACGVRARAFSRAKCKTITDRYKSRENLLSKLIKRDVLQGATNYCEFIIRSKKNPVKPEHTIFAGYGYYRAGALPLMIAHVHQRGLWLSPALRR